MKYFKNFQNHADYEEYIESGEVLYPNVCWCNEEKDIHYDCVKPYISDGLVFHLDGEDYDDVNKTWTDRIQNIVFPMTNSAISDDELGGVYFNGNTYGGLSDIPLVPLNSTHTIEVVYDSKGTTGGSIFSINNGNRINYVRSNKTVWRKTGSEVTLVPENLGKATHALTSSLSIFNGKSLGYTTGTTYYNNGTSTQVYIGASNRNAMRMIGNVYQIRIYNRKLTGEEILYNQEQDRKRYGIIFENTAEE